MGQCYVYFENYMKPITKLCGQDADIFMLKYVLPRVTAVR
jgi:hypothetical protein